MPKARRLPGSLAPSERFSAAAAATKDHNGADVKILWANWKSPKLVEGAAKWSWDKNPTIPPPFSFQVYLLPAAVSVARDIKFLEKFQGLVDIGDSFGGFSQHCCLQLYCEPQPSVRACVEHHREERVHRQRLSKDQMTHTKTPPGDESCCHIIIVLEHEHWQEAGIVFAGSTPAIADSEDAYAWETFVHTDQEAYPAYRMKSPRETGATLGKIFRDAGGLETEIAVVSQP